MSETSSDKPFCEDCGAIIPKKQAEEQAKDAEELRYVLLGFICEKCAVKYENPIIQLNPGGKLLIKVTQRFGEPVTFIVTTPSYMQDDGMGGCLIVTGDWGAVFGRVAHWGSDKDRPEWGDVDDVPKKQDFPEIPASKSVILGHEFP